ncbi:hypothetical protein RFI_04136 [Reticulomyxa filosa]|uniref:Kelch motif family protein n=1 Tax=Reticulomyxa filosa TaxID=46433 RepID=X6P4H3_RETFI|nr:hypothetical protein RFI_04136 [Reticulomyxa filosa]|eukprot:ETO32969.1 hypothetical protein RFI_04136 [Reticulomyxa filosa]
MDTVYNQITLLSFGSDLEGKNKHTLLMKYVSVWSNISNKSNKLNSYNQWIPFTDNHNHPIIIGIERDQDNYIGVRALTGGSKNHLLFIICLGNNISVFDLNAFQFIKHNFLPAGGYYIEYPCFVSNLENGQEQEMIKTNKQNCQMLFFCRKAGSLIEYDEDKNIFRFYQLPVCDDIALFNAYAYVCINDVILFFGGSNYPDISRSVYKYSIREKKWVTFENILPNLLYDCVAILSEEDNDIYIIGGLDNKKKAASTHMKTRLRVWDPSQLVIICLYFEEAKLKYLVNHALDMILILILFHNHEIWQFFRIIFKIYIKKVNN